MSRILLTRPLAESKELAALLADVGYDSVIDPMLTIQPLPTARAQLIGLGTRQFQAVIITSQHAVEAVHLSPELLALPAYAVGLKSAKAARRAGFTKTHVGARGVTELAAQIGAELNPRSGNLLYLRAQQVSQFIQPLLPAFNIQEIITYRAVPSTHLSDTARQALMQQDIGAVLFFSRQSALAFQQAANDVPLDGVAAICLSADVASALDGSRWKEVKIATHPTQSAMLAALPASICS